jgi:hypothetical protein
LKEIEANYSDLIDNQIIPLYPHVAEIFGTSEPFNVLLRPDNYIAFISCDPSPISVVNYLSSLLGAQN